MTTCNIGLSIRETFFTLLKKLIINEFSSTKQSACFGWKTLSINIKMYFELCSHSCDVITVWNTKLAEQIFEDYKIKLKHE